MKKVILILAMGLLWCNASNALSVNDIIKPGMTKKQVKKIIYKGKLKKTFEMQRTHDPKAQGMCGFNLTTQINQYFPEFRTEITTHRTFDSAARAQPDEFPWYVFENVNIPIRMSSLAFCKEGDGILKGVYYNKEAALIAADPNYLVRKKEDEKNIADSDRNF